MEAILELRTRVTSIWEDTEMYWLAIAVIAGVEVLILAAVAVIMHRVILENPDSSYSKAQSQFRLVNEEISKLWDCMQGEIRRQSVRDHRSKKADRTQQPQLQSRDDILADFERMSDG